jgi:hypothetical protein
VGDLLSPATIKRRKEPAGPFLEFSVAFVDPNGQRPEGNTYQDQIDVIILVDVRGYQVRRNMPVKLRLEDNAAVAVGKLDLDRECGTLYCADSHVGLVITIEVPGKPILDVLILGECGRRGQACKQQSGNRTDE